MFSIRETKTRSGKIAVQVVLRRYHQTEIVKHIGTGDDSEEISRLKILARQFIREKERLIPLFPDFDRENDNDLVSASDLEIVGYKHQFAYEYLMKFYSLNGFDQINSEILKDLCLIRIVKPVSKRQSLMLINEYFGKNYSLSTFYKTVGKLVAFKDQTEQLAVSYAKDNLNFDFSVVFYDVTTLYFETFDGDNFRKPGFSKDNKSSQPQILIALVVNGDGYPIASNIFEGNKFEGHTIIPVVLALKEKHKIENLTVVADAAMLSRNNMEHLNDSGLNYIVGARLSNLKQNLIEKISLEIDMTPGKYFKTKTEQNGLGYLICDFSLLRASKDKSDRNKQLLKAQNQINNPAKFLKRSRFVTEETKSVYRLNEELIKQDKLLDGIKGYYTNLENMDNSLIVARYHDLWKIEKAFRVAKSDLLARPIFHRKRENIEAHILIVFLALCVAKSIELKTGMSVGKIKEKIWKVLDVELKDKLTGKTFIKQTSVPVLPILEY